MLSREQIKDAATTIELIEAAKEIKLALKKDSSETVNIGTGDIFFDVTTDVAVKVLDTVIAHYEEELKIINI